MIAKDERPSEALRKAFISKELAWRSWKDGWTGTGESRQVQAILKPLPLGAEEAQQFIQWWEKSRQQGCEMLLPLASNRAADLADTADLADDSALAAAHCFQEEKQAWICLQPYSGSFNNKMTLENWCSIAKALARLHFHSSPWPLEQGKGGIDYWVRVLQERLGELLLYRGILRRRGCRTDFEGLFMENFDIQYRRGQEALNRLVFALQSPGSEQTKQWALCGVSNREILWQEGQPYFLDILPYASFSMMDLCLLLKTGLADLGREEGILQCLLNAYQTEKNLTWEDCQLLQAQWFFPEGFWCHARCYFLLKECHETETCFDQLSLCLMQENEVQQFLEGVIQW